MAADSKSPDVDVSACQSIPAESHQAPPPRKKLWMWLWDADQHLKSPEERRLVQKLDCCILICATLGWWMKYVDQSNLTNAYVSGMKEDLNIHGNEYNYMLTCYTVAFAIMQIPSNMIAVKIPPRFLILACELGWTVFTFAQAGATSSNQMYAFRFMIGLFESSFSPIIIFLLGSWYTKPELGKRISIWHITGFFGQATSGFLQAGIHSSLDGHLGVAGWRWMYIICGCMSLVVAFSVWVLLPDYPHNTRAWYLNEEERRLAISRMKNHGRAEISGILNAKLAKRMFGNWRWWTLCLMYIFYGNSCQASTYFAIYLREEGYSVTQRNIIPACSNLVSMVTDFTWAFMSDLTGNRVHWMIWPVLCTTTLGTSILTAWDVPDYARVLAFFFLAGGFVTGVTWTWANEINTGNAEERALTISSMNGLFYATNSFLPLLIYPQTMAPKFERGYPATLAFSLVAIAFMLVADFFHKRQLRQEAAQIEGQPVSEVTKDTDYDGNGDEKQKS